MHRTQHGVRAVGLCSHRSGVCVVCCDSKSDGDLDAVTEVGCVRFVLTARVTVILMQTLKWGVCGLF